MKYIPQIPTEDQLPYLDYAQIFTASSIMFDTGKGQEIATFDVTVREMPGLRNFMLLGGIEQMVNTILNWKYDPKFVGFLLEEKMISPNFAKHLKDFKFRGKLWAMPEGSVFFPGEPVIRITTSLSDANLMTAFLVNVITYPTLFMSKAIRIRLACKEKHFFLAGAMRAFGFENILKVQRLSYIIGSVIAMPFVPYHFGVAKRKAAVGFYHALIKSFPDEKEAYRHFLPYMKEFGISTSMVDTYDVKKGIENWIEVEKEARKKGQSLGYVSIDSGDVFETAMFLREKLDEAGLNDVGLTAYSNLDEYKIAELERKGAPIALYCPVTEVTSVADRPVLEAVYKLAETIDKDGKITYAAKLAPGKLSLPGRKQVFRNYDKNGKMISDFIGLQDEKLGTPLLKKYINDNKLVEDLPSLDEIKVYVESQLSTLPEELKEVDKQHPFKVEVSEEVKKLLEDIKKKRLH